MFVGVAAQQAGYLAPLFDVTTVTKSDIVDISRLQHSSLPVNTHLQLLGPTFVSYFITRPVTGRSLHIYRLITQKGFEIGADKEQSNTRNVIETS